MSITGNRHIPSLDGIRALAAMLVFASHAFAAPWIPSSLGVTVFFFLSGYLITTLLRREWDGAGHISLVGFYLRRSCRIFPPMLFMLALILAITLAARGADAVDGAALLLQFAHLSNYLIVLSGGDHSLLPHTSVLWSLAVEEHFYLLFPLLFIWLTRRLAMPRMGPLLLAGCLLALLWRLALVRMLHVPEAHIYYATDARFDSLLFGCIMGVWRNPVLDFRPATAVAPGAGQKLLLLGALLLLLLTLLWRHPLFQQTLRYSLQGIALFPLFWLAVRYPRWLPFRPLNWKPLRWLGMISYSFYLSHPLWLSLAHDMVGGMAGAALGFGLSVLFSAALYWKLERPLLAFGHGMAIRMALPGWKEQA